MDRFQIYLARQHVKLENRLDEGDEGEERIKDDLQISDKCTQDNHAMEKSSGGQGLWGYSMKIPP